MPRHALIDVRLKHSTDAVVIADSQHQICNFAIGRNQEAGHVQQSAFSAVAVWAPFGDFHTNKPSLLEQFGCYCRRLMQGTRSSVSNGL